MVNISYLPAKELIILEMVEYGLRELAETCALLIEAGRPVILNWAEGVVFHHTPLPFNTKELMKERMKGRIYWASVIYAEMPEHTPVIKVGTRDIPVLATPNPVLKQVARWMKERLGRERP
jgi:hypothetical protein